MDLYETIMARRTIRKFKQTPIERHALEKLIDVARMAPTGANRQPLMFGIIADPSVCSQVFAHTKWASLLGGAHSPSEIEAPTAYIAVLSKEEEAAGAELAAGSAVENMLILAKGMGIGSCWLGAIDRKKIAEILGLGDGYKILYLVAFGYPAEDPAATDYDGDIKYFLDETGRLNVPKKTFSQVILFDK